VTFIPAAQHCALVTCQTDSSLHLLYESHELHSQREGHGTEPEDLHFPSIQSSDPPVFDQLQVQQSQMRPAIGRQNHLQLGAATRT